MGAFASGVGEGLQAIIYGVATALLYPVLALEVVALVLVAFAAGRFTLEAFRRRRARKKLDIEAIAASAASGEKSGEEGAALAFLGELSSSPVMARAKTSLGDGTDLSRTRVLKALADAELEATRRLEHTRILVRLGPILGLMGTLIPISPALVGLAQGDVATLSNNLVIAFSTTVVGLLIGGVAYVVTTMRDRFYQQDVVDLEYVFDRIVV
jgi:biopolymer transport protein ExbB/TolQ